MTNLRTLLLTSLCALNTVTAAPGKLRHQGKRYWPGWGGVKYLFSFGDSYTTTGFDVHGTQPSPENPLGNPEWWGWTSSNGPNWIDFLTTTYNETSTQTYNMAFGGATVDSDLVKPYAPGVLSVKQQIQDEFLPTYGEHPADIAPWKGKDSLFAFWIGINDVGGSYWAQNETLYPIIFGVYAGLVDQLYVTGARNFLFLNVPPVNRSPATLSQGDNTAEGVRLEAAAIADWNTRIDALAANLTDTYADVTAIQYDANSIFGRVLDNPSVTPQTAIYENTTWYCPQYADGTPDPNYYDPACGVAVEQYFWFNNLHPTYPMHNATAGGVASLLNKVT